MTNQSLTEEQSEALESEHEFQCEQRNESFFEGYGIEEPEYQS